MNTNMDTHKQTLPGEPHVPDQLGLVAAFVNTRSIETGKDYLQDPDALRHWLVERQLMASGEYVGESDLRQALQMREGLRAMASANNRGEPDPEALDALNGAADRCGLVIRFEEDGCIELRPRVSGASAGLARILGIVYSAVVRGTWPRLKACRRESCGRVFYDHSKNRSATWCSMATCGNREKARTYRRRKQRRTVPVDSVSEPL